MEEKIFGDRNDKGNYIPKKRVSYPPIFVWPLAPIRALKWIFSIPGYFLPWNLFYVGIGLISWFTLSPPLDDYADLTITTCISVLPESSEDTCLYRLFILLTKLISYSSRCDLVICVFKIIHLIAIIYNVNRLKLFTDFFF